MPTITIMLATGEKAWGQIARRALEAAQDMQLVAEIPDGPAALDAAKAHRPDVVVLDQDTPPAGALPLMLELRQAHPAARVLVVTPETDDAFAVEVVRHGGRGLLAEPALPTYLPKAVRSVMAGEAWLTRRQERLVREALRGLIGPDPDRV